MRIIKNRTIIANQWRLDRDGDANDANGERRIVPLARYREMRADDSTNDSPREIGVLLQPHERVEEIAGDLDRIALIALEFGTFNEGRGYSQAARLRRQYNYRGEIRALGACRDNLPLMERCGIDAYQLADGEDLAEALSAFEEITEYY